MQVNARTAMRVHMALVVLRTLGFYRGIVLAMEPDRVDGR
jgi:hypothetical protein